MKRFFLLVVCGLVLAVSVQAQGIIAKSPSPELKVEFKRCIAEEGRAFIDILITNASRRDTKIDLSRGWIDVYDDEGNVYNNNNITGDEYNVYIASSNVDSQPLASVVEIPAGIAYKARVILSGGFDKYAVAVQLLKISFTWNVFNSRTSGSWETSAIEFRNLPIIRE